MLKTCKKGKVLPTDRQRDRPTNQHSDLYGLGRLDDGLGRLEDGLGWLEDGLGRLEDGLGQLEDGFGWLEALIFLIF